SVHGINNPARNIRTQCLEFLKLCATFIGGSIIGLFFKKAGDKVSTALRSTIETDAKAAIKESKKNDGEEEEDAAEEEPVQKVFKIFPRMRLNVPKTPFRPQILQDPPNPKPQLPRSHIPHQSLQSIVPSYLHVLMLVVVPRCNPLKK
ncbi:hypothetical protein ADUPG1_001679, partial [Aduncisulcus paluster]